MTIIKAHRPHSPVKVIKLTQWQFGIPDHEVRIPAGFETVAKEGEFLLAKQREKLFFVEEFKNFFRLTPREARGNQVCARTDRAIRIGKE